MFKNLRLISCILLAGLVLPLTRPGESRAQLAGGGSYVLEEGERNFQLAGIPIPNYSDVLGVSLGIVGMAYYKLDRDDHACPPSVTGLFAFYSENQSWIGAGFQKIHYDQDRWRGTLAFGLGSLEYQFNPAALNPGFPDIFVDYTTVTNFFLVNGSHQIRENLFLGLEVLSWAAQVSLEPDLVNLPDERYTGPGMIVEWDRRDNIMFPTTGYHLDGRFTVYSEATGSDRAFNKLKLTLSGYHSLGDSTRILAGRIMTESSFGDVPFSGQAILSGNKNLRGYSNGRNRADGLMMLESEYRWNFWGRWSVAAFAGVAWVADDLGAIRLDAALPASGLGMRFRMIESYGINARVDFAWGQDDQGLYISIGEAF